MISFFKNLFKKSQLLPHDPKLLELYNIQKQFQSLVLDVGSDFAMEHPFYLHDNIYSSWVKVTPADNPKIAKYLPNMGGALVSTRFVIVGNFLTFGTVKFPGESIFWIGEVISIKAPGKIYLKRFRHFCHRS